MPSFNIRSILIAATFVAAIASPAAAQTSAPTAPGQSELGLGYSLLRDSSSDQTLVAGWVAAAGLRVHRAWWLAGEVGGHYKTLAADHNLRVHSFMGGVRYARQTGDEVRPFAQILLGVVCYCGSTTTDGTAKRSFAIQPGAGVDLPLRDKWWARLQADYRSVRAEGHAFGQFRFTASAVYFFGSTQ